MAWVHHLIALCQIPFLRRYFPQIQKGLRFRHNEERPTNNHCTEFPLRQNISHRLLNLTVPNNSCHYQKSYYIFWDTCSSQHSTIAARSASLYDDYRLGPSISCLRILKASPKIRSHSCPCSPRRRFPPFSLDFFATFCCNTRLFFP